MHMPWHPPGVRLPPLASKPGPELQRMTYSGSDERFKLQHSLDYLYA